ncbi:MAG TPA: MerR family transcriptional regulator [Ktedonobacteraceae bacterium]|nr:MerR family transcriptional regulator [Ktedonobacteraceae bacterium]
MLATNEQEFLSGSDAACAYSIEQVAAQTGLTKRTLRYYEEVGLLPPTDRTEGNYRRYSDEDIRRLERIKMLRDLLGFALADIREILETEDERGVLREAYKHASEAAAKISQLDQSDELIRKQLKLIEQKIEGLGQMRASLLQQIERHALKRRTLQESDTRQSME